MADNITPAGATRYLGTALTYFVQLHTANPTDAGTAAVAARSTRQSATFSAPASGATSNTAKLTFPGVATAETISHVSLWTLVTGGVCEWQGPLDANVALGANEGLEIAIGDLDLTLT